MMGKRAAAFELREKKIASYYYKIQQLITRCNFAPLDVDYSSEIEAMIKAHKTDKGLILQAERDAFVQHKK